MTLATRVRNRTRAGVIAVLALGLVGLIVAIAFTLSDTGRRLAGTNDVPPAQPVQQLAPGQGFCQADTIFGHSSGLRFLALTNGKPTPSLSVFGAVGPRHFMQGSVPAGWREGWITVPVRYVPGDVSGGDVCMNNTGSTPVTIFGYLKTVRFEFYRPGNESWGSLGSAVVHRFGLVKAGWEGSWTVWLVGFLVVLAGAIAGWSLIRTAEG